jgi:hypothetical protein
MATAKPFVTVVTDRTLTLSSAIDTIDLYTWAHNGPLTPGVQATGGAKGFGWTAQTNRWFEGAGHGATYRGTRILPRDMEIPLWIQERDRDKLNDLLGRLSLMFNPRYAPVRLTYGLPGNELWYTDVVREAGGDYTRRVESDNTKWLKSVINLRAGVPYWSRVVPDSFIVQEDTSGRGLMPNLAELQVSFRGAFGAFTVANVGDADSLPSWQLLGPFTHFKATGPLGENLEWYGTVALGESLTIVNGTVRDQAGVNRYDGLEDSPKFWKIAPGTATVSVIMDGTTSATRAIGQWTPRKWAVI